jgi:hypothetical protein
MDRDPGRKLEFCGRYKPCKDIGKDNVNDFALQKEAFGNGKAAELIIEHLLKNYNR